MNVTKTARLRVPGASLYYEVRGGGPVLLVIQGGAAGAGHLDGMVERLARHYTVVIYDRRGLSRSPVDQPGGGDILRAHREDVHHLLAEVADEPVHVVGASFGALIGLDLLARHPGQVRLLVAHEPPALHLLADPDRADAVRVHEDVEQAYQRGGVAEAMPPLMAMVGLSGARPAGAPSAAEIVNLNHFLANDFPAVRHHRFDPRALAAVKVVPAVGRNSSGLIANRCAHALAARLEVPVLELPGGHAGFATHPVDCAQRLLDFLDR